MTKLPSLNPETVAAEPMETLFVAVVSTIPSVRVKALLTIIGRLNVMAFPASVLFTIKLKNVVVETPAMV